MGRDAAPTIRSIRRWSRKSLRTHPPVFPSTTRSTRNGRVAVIDFAAPRLNPSRGGRSRPGARMRREDRRDDPVDRGQVDRPGPAVPSRPRRNRGPWPPCSPSTRRSGGRHSTPPVRPSCRATAVPVSRRGLQVVAPEFRPGQAAEEQEEREARNPEARHAVSRARTSVNCGRNGVDDPPALRPRGHQR